MKFLEKISKLDHEKLLRMKSELAESGHIGHKIEVGGVVLEDTTAMQLDFQKICDALADELFDESDNSGFPKAQEYWKDNGFPPQATIGDVVKHFILES